VLTDCNFYFKNDPVTVLSDKVDIDNYDINKIVQTPSGDHTILSLLKFEDAYYILLDNNDENRSG